MNIQVNQALTELQQFKTLLPLPCNLHENHCNSNCFSQQIFNVTHSKKTKNISKVAYRVIAHKDFVEQLCNPDTTAKYPIGRENICDYTNQGSRAKDAYLLENILNNPREIITTEIKSDNDNIQAENPVLSGPKIIGRIDLSKFEKKNTTYIIDTNVFLDCPDIIQKINKKDNIILSAKVIDELDSLKVKLPDKLNEINTAFRVINKNMGSRKITMESADLKLLPDDFNKKSPDNFILSVALKHNNNNAVLLTSDNGLQVKAKGMNVKTISLKKFNNLMP
jgi:rRNA-processing protein FCF1